MSDWDVVVHSRDPHTWYSLTPMQAAHGPNCEGPYDPAASTHHVSDYGATVFQCKDHMMTALNGGEYGLIYLTPNQLVDFSAGEAVIRWDMSTFRSSGRDWVDLWITPFEQNLTMPLEEWIPDVQGQPKNAIHIRMDGSGDKGAFEGGWKIFVLKDGVESWYVPRWNPYNNFLTPDKARRDTFELRISRDYIKLSMPGYGQVLQEARIPALNWTSGIVQFGHHSYNPTKGPGWTPNTWHWDNISIEPAVPFTMIRADRRYVDGNNQEMRFASPAPQNAYLRFSAIGKPEVSFNGGATWEAPRRNDGTRQTAPEHFSSYFTPIPAGTNAVQFRFKPDSWYAGPYMAKDAAIWSASGLPDGQTTPTKSAPTATPTKPAATATATRPAPTATPTKPAATATPTKVAPTPTPTSSRPSATATATATKPLPTATPTRPAPTATATAPTSISVSGGVSASKSSLSRLQTVTLNAWLKSNVSGTASVSLEVYAPNGARVHRAVFDRQYFTAGATTAFRTAWRPSLFSLKGTYSIRLRAYNGSTTYFDLFPATTFTLK